MKNYYRVMLGRKSAHAALCYQGNFIGTGFLKEIDLTGKLPDDWRSFNKEFIPVWQEKNPGKSKIAAGLACGALWVVSKGIQKARSAIGMLRHAAKACSSLHCKLNDKKFMPDKD